MTSSCPPQEQSRERSDTGRGQRRQDGERLDEALVEHPEHDIDGDESGGDQKRLRGERGLEGLRRALETAFAR